jgi:hypothetical protein
MGRKSEWNHLPTTNPRVPKNFTKALLAIAKALDTKTPRELAISVDGIEFEISVRLKQVDAPPASTSEVELEPEMSDYISLSQANGSDRQPKIVVEEIEHSKPELTVELEMSDDFDLQLETIDEPVELAEVEHQPEIINEPVRAIEQVSERVSPVEDIGSTEQFDPNLPELEPQIKVQATRLAGFSISDFGMKLYAVWKELACQHSENNPWGTPIELNQIYRHGFSNLIGQQFLSQIEQLISAGLQKTGDLELVLLPGNLNLKIAGRDVESITYQVSIPNASVKNATVNNSSANQPSQPQQFSDRQTVHQNFERLRQERQKRMASRTSSPPIQPIQPEQRERDGFLAGLSRLLSL